MNTNTDITLNIEMTGINSRKDIDAILQENSIAPDDRVFAWLYENGKRRGCIFFGGTITLCTNWKGQVKDTRKGIANAIANAVGMRNGTIKRR